jgi:hypothetical protein
MKNLLKHLKSELHEELNTVENEKLRLVYEDLLRKTNMALSELRVEQPDNMDADRFRHLAGNESRESSQPSNEPKVDLEASFDRAGEGTYDPDEELEDHAQSFTDDHHARRDGSNESFDELRENIQNVTAEDFNPERLRELADIAEAAEESDDVDPRDMSNGDFEKLLSRLRPNLVDWAAGKKENLVEKLDQTEIASEIRNALHRAQQESDGNIDMLRSFQQHVSDSIFDTSLKMDDEYTPEYEDVKLGDRLDIDENEIRDPREENIHPNNVRDSRKP